jgi:ring-1,2-phenylacetyl-CoA epoxidase subunit PaaC
MNQRAGTRTQAQIQLRSADIAQYALRLGDDALIAAQRLTELCAQAPELEEDVALTNIALDQLGVARLLLSYVAQLARTELGDATMDGEPWSSFGLPGQVLVDEDSLAFLREDHEFRNCLLVELPNAGPHAPAGAEADFAVVIVKLLFLSAYQMLLYQELASCADATLAAVGGKAVKESAYHLDHASVWTIRLGDGTEFSHQRMRSAVDDLWPYSRELFQDDALTDRLAAARIAPVPSRLRKPWLAQIDHVLAAATLSTPAGDFAPSGGRTGRHTEHLAYLLAEMQVLHRAHPGARW